MNSSFDAIRLELPAGCMRPETSWNGAAFLYGLVCLTQPEVVVEIGSFRGTTSLFLAQALKDSQFGSLTCYEESDESADETASRLAALWPSGKWEVVYGDFFKTLRGGYINFAFLDIAPKSLYLPAYEKIRSHMALGSILVAHDLNHSEGADEVLKLKARMLQDGWGILSLPHERGFLVGIWP